MSEMAAALADNSKLTPYRGRDVLMTSIAIRNAGDGLSEAMSIDPVELEIGSRVTVVLDCEVADHVHKPIKGTAGLALKQVLSAGTATIIDADVVSQALAQQADRIQRAREEAQGVRRLPTGDELEREHARGDHDDETVDGCSLCDEERDPVVDGE